MGTALAAVLCGCAPSARPSQGATEPVPQSDTAATAEVAPDDSLPDPGSVTAEGIRRASGHSLEEILEGRVSGVSVLRTSNGIAVRIRGYSSMLGGNEPLYVLDGIPINPGPGGALIGLSPNDIESIKVLKDPSSTALYGVRGANGVVLITTKRPGR